MEAGGRPLLRAWAHLPVLWAFAVAQPVLQVLADSAAFLVARGNSWPDLVLVTLGLVLVPPTAMVAIEAVLPRAGLRRYLHLAFIGLLVAAFAFQVLKGELVPLLESCLALAFGAGVAFAYDRGRLVPTVLSVLSPVPVLLLVWFLGFSPASELAWPGTGPEVERGTVPRPAPVVVVIFDEFSSASLLDGKRRDRCHALAQVRRSRGGVDLVPQRDHGGGPDHQSRPRDHDRPASRGGVASHPRRPPGQPVRPPRRPVRLQRQGDDHSPLCGRALRPNGDEWPTRARLLAGSMASIMRSRLSPGDSSDYLGVPAETVERRPEIFREFVEQIEPGRTLSLHHSDLPHVPYQYTRSRRYTTATDLPGLSAEQWTDDPGRFGRGCVVI